MIAVIILRTCNSSLTICTQKKMLLYYHNNYFIYIATFKIFLVNSTAHKFSMDNYYVNLMQMKFYVNYFLNFIKKKFFLL